jgi:hypothetical protein
MKEPNQKLAIGIISTVATTIFLGALGLSVRATEINSMQEVRLARIEDFIARQDRINEKLEGLIERLRHERVKEPRQP